VGFVWALRSGQYDDLDGAAERILFDGNDASDQGENEGASDPVRPSPR
jgi:nitrogen fixation-related uncharacterized protein